MTANDLLLKYLNYQNYWGKHAVDSKPATKRLQQLGVLLEAFGITKKYMNPSVKVNYSILGDEQSFNRRQYLDRLTNLEYFQRGEFLKDRPDEENKLLIDKVSTVMCELYSVSDELIRGKLHFSWLFNNLLQYRSELYRFTLTGSVGMLEGFSAGLLYSLYLQRKLNGIIKEHVEEIDETLCQLIDPKQRDFSKEELITKYNYPDVDLEKIDLEWERENY